MSGAFRDYRLSNIPVVRQDPGGADRPQRVAVVPSSSLSGFAAHGPGPPVPCRPRQGGRRTLHHGRVFRSGRYPLAWTVPVHAHTGNQARLIPGRCVSDPDGKIFHVKHCMRLLAVAAATGSRCVPVHATRECEALGLCGKLCHNVGYRWPPSVGPTPRSARIPR